MSQGDGAEQELICSLEASLPPADAEQLPPGLVISSERSLNIVLIPQPCLLPTQSFS